jgi:hypothetical protein
MDELHTFFNENDGKFSHVESHGNSTAAAQPQRCAKNVAWAPLVSGPYTAPFRNGTDATEENGATI